MGSYRFRSVFSIKVKSCNLGSPIILGALRRYMQFFAFFCLNAEGNLVLEPFVVGILSCLYLSPRHFPFDMLVKCYIITIINFVCSITDLAMCFFMCSCLLAHFQYNFYLITTSFVQKNATSNNKS